MTVAEFEPPSGPLARIQAALFDHAPRRLGQVTFLAGVVSVTSAANPEALSSLPLPAFVRELPNFAGVIGGLALMMLSVGLMRRVRAAYFVTLAFAAHGLLLAAWLKPRLVEAILFAGLILVLAASRSAFFRRSAIGSLRLPRIWFVLAALGIALAAVAAALWAGHRSGFIAAPWWDLLLHPQLGAAGRPVALAAGLLALLAFASLVAAPSAPPAPAPMDDDFARAEEILTRADRPRPESMLAFSGDKSFLFTPSGRTFLMYAVTGNAMIAMGAPVGPREEWREALSLFRQNAERLGAQCALYSAPPELLPDLLDLGFRVEKIGETAVLDLASFTLSGRKREVIRRARRRLAEREGAQFVMLAPEQVEGALPRLKPVSDAWLQANGGREKAFSLGRFDPAFLRRCPVGVVEIKGRAVAFGSLLTTPDKGWAGIDLMRYDPAGAVTNTMDFLLVELIHWAREEGYRGFDLSMAPLSGLVEAQHAPLFARIGRVIFERGERFYNFQGIRRFKEKFDPDWEPRYIAAPGYWNLPMALTSAALLTAGAAQPERERT